VKKSYSPVLALLIALLFQSSSLFAQSLYKDTGLIMGKGVELVAMHCTSCHSAKLVAQNRMSRKSWLATIRWMQETQNLWPLGPAEEGILNYLEKNYSPVAGGRRKPIPDELLPSD
tara:strand:+ start:57517 stop:57864 length:348 start_codon:yes stop_codon:yes gene_type:complete